MKKNICVLLSTFNGELYLKDLLNSLFALDNIHDVDIFVRDDGSTDGTLEVIKAYQNYKNFFWFQGENIGPAWSFFELAKKIDNYQFYAFCDQDDVWNSDKLVVALSALSKENNSIPLLYFSETHLVDKNLRPLKQSAPLKLKLTFGESLVQCAGAGCTFVFNKKARDMFVLYNPNNHFMVMHDRLLHMIVAATGKLIYDINSHIEYRQHGKNVVGKTTNPFKRINKAYKMLFWKSLRGAWLAQAKNMDVYRPFMTQKNVDILDVFINYKNSYKAKRKAIRCKDICRTTWQENLWLKIKYLLNAV